jgi:hypothetical protein
MVEIIQTILSWLPKGSYTSAQNTLGELANGKKPTKCNKTEEFVL